MISYVGGKPDDLVHKISGGSYGAGLLAANVSLIHTDAKTSRDGPAYYDWHERGTLATESEDGSSFKTGKMRKMGIMANPSLDDMTPEKMKPKVEEAKSCSYEIVHSNLNSMTAPDDKRDGSAEYTAHYELEGTTGPT